ADRLDHDPPPPQTRVPEIYRLEKVGKAIAQHVARKEVIEQQQRAATAHQNDRRQKAPPAAADAEQVALLLKEDPTEKVDQFAQTEVAERREYADPHGQQDQFDVFELRG